jgi:acyl-CoA reductase-like NAD-dependent aldehyde dehydrogenase
MTIAILLIGVLIGAALGWRIGRWRASAALIRVNRAMGEEVRYWQDAAARASDKALRAAEEAKTWADGCRQGRQDVISIVPLLMAARERDAASGPAGNGIADCR